MWPYFAPKYIFQFPFSGSVSQDIKPEVDFYSSIPEEAGNSAKEKAICEQYSYGTQLSIMMRLLEAMLVELVPDEPDDLSDEFYEARANFYRMTSDIIDVKAGDIR